MAFQSNGGILKLNSHPKSFFDEINNEKVEKIETVKKQDDSHLIALLNTQNVQAEILKKLEYLRDEFSEFKKDSKMPVQIKEETVSKPIIEQSEPAPYKSHPNTKLSLPGDSSSIYFFSNPSNVQMVQAIIIVGIIVLIILTGFIVLKMVLTSKKIAKKSSQYQ